MKTILVTGGLGFYRSHNCVSLINNNFNVYIIDSLTNSKRRKSIFNKKICKLSDSSSKGKITFFKGDIKDRQFLINIFNNALKMKRVQLKLLIHLQD